MCFIRSFCRPAITAFGRSIQCGVDKCWVYKARLTALKTLHGTMSAQKALQGSKTRQLQEGTNKREKNLLSDKRSFDCKYDCNDSFVYPTTRITLLAISLTAAISAGIKRWVRKLPAQSHK